MVVLERLPITVTPMGGEVTVSNVRFGEHGVAMTVASEGGAAIAIEGVAEMQVGPGEQQIRVQQAQGENG